MKVILIALVFNFLISCWPKVDIISGIIFANLSLSGNMPLFKEQLIIYVKDSERGIFNFFNRYVEIPSWPELCLVFKFLIISTVVVTSIGLK